MLAAARRGAADGGLRPGAATPFLCPVIPATHRLLPLLCAALAVAAAAQVPARVPLQLVQALPMEGPDNLQPSGLTLVDGELFAISDKHDHAICRVDLRRERAVLDPYITFDAPWSGAWTRGLDFEGLAYLDGSFFLASESTFRVLRVGADGRGVEWVTPSVEVAGREVGLFGVTSARIEGIAALAPGRFLLAAEREPRGLVEVDVSASAPEEGRLRAFALDATALALPAPRRPDFSDLFLEGQTLFALARNADAVVRVAFDETGLHELEAWTYGHVANDPQYAYADMTYGKAEGLCMDGERVYLVVDNNGQARQGDPSDTRPLLFIFERPR